MLQLRLNVETEAPTYTQSHLRAVREAQGLGLRQAARLAGVDPGHLSKVERGEAGFSLDALVRLAQVLGLQELERLLSPYAKRKT